MMYKCERCSYTTNRKSNLDNHKKRKNPCCVVISKELPTTPTNETKSHEFKCPKCEKVLSSGKSLKKHEEKCDGLHPLQCRTCLKMFASRYGKYQHVKNVKCKPVNNGPTQVINNNGNITNNSHNDNSHNVTNNIINNFYNYTHDHVELDKLKSECRSIKSSMECITKYLEHTFFNPEHPETKNISLTNLRTDYKFIDVFNDGKWIKDIQLDVIKGIINRYIKLSRQMLIDENPEKSPDLDATDDMEETDNLKKFANNYMTDFNTFKKRVFNKAKSDIYNNSLRICI